MRILVTGTAGLIGFHVARRLIALGHEVVGLDGMTSYYDVTLKRRRHAMLLQTPSFTAQEVMLEDSEAMTRAWEAARPDVVIHLAAQAGVRYSIESPRSYLESNLVGTFNVLELARHQGLQHLLLASTSSVYGSNEVMPFEETQRTDHSLTFYAATKKATEVMAHSYAHLFQIPTTVFRFFTVYGPWGRPDMALFKFVKGILEGTPIDIYNHGQMARDFTYVDDLAEAIVKLVDAVPKKIDADERFVGSRDSLSPSAPHRVVNIGNAAPVPLLDFIDEIERVVGRPAIRNYLEMQQGDVPRTSADTTLLRDLTGFSPSTSVADGIRNFVSWYRDYHNV